MTGETGGRIGGGAATGGRGRPPAAPTPSTRDSLADYLAAQQARVEQALPRCLPASAELSRKLHEAMAYSLLGGGKRIRPILCLTAGEALGAAEADLLPVALALELIHSYSLVHDDLPAMDDDDWRRGRPTCHRAFGEATAVLAGDGLLTLAFEVIARETQSHELVAPLVTELARAAGACGMVGGQSADLACASRRLLVQGLPSLALGQTLHPPAGGEGREPDAALLEFVHRHKTAALLRAAVVCGALAARAPRETLERVEQYGEAIGLAFQVVDDILDVTGEQQALGKAVNKDAGAGKLTYPTVHGLERAREIARELCERACAAVAGLPGGERLAGLARFIVGRST